MNIKKIMAEGDPALKNKLRDILKELDFVDVNPSWDITLKCFTVMKVLPLDSTIPVQFMELLINEDLHGSVKRYEKGSDICVFKLYN